MATRDTAQINLPWIESPWWEESLASRHLSAGDETKARSFARDGYLILDLPLQEMNALVETIKQTLDVQLQQTRRIQDAWKTIPAVRELASAPSILSLLRTLYEREPIPFQTLNFRIGTEQPTHSDALHFHTFPQRFMCGAWVALEDVDENNGPLSVYPGSHRFPVWELHDFGLENLKAEEAHHLYEDAIAKMVEGLGLQKKTLPLKKGQVILWAANLLHRGEPIRDPSRTRWTQVTHITFDGCALYTPHRSDLLHGIIHMRPLIDIRTGEEILPVIDGHRVRVTGEQAFWIKPGLGSFLKAVYERLIVSIRRKRQGM